MVVKSMAKKRYTFEEYLALERAEGIRYEYWDGEVLAMAGTTKRHNTIVQNLTFALRPHSTVSIAVTETLRINQFL